MKRSVVFMLILALLVSLAVGCTPATTPTNAPTSGPTLSPTPIVKIPIKFYGLVKEFPDGEAMIQKMQELLPQYDIQPIQVDWGNLTQVISVGIASGDPCDVYAYWPGYMKNFVEAGQAADLTPFLDADNGAWRKTLSPGILKTGEYDGKVYNVSYEVSFSCMFANVDAFTKAGLTINPRWTWDEFMAAMKSLHDSGIETPFATFDDAVKMPFKMMFQDLIDDEGKMIEASTGAYSLNGADATKALTAVKSLFDSGYWYGKKGGLNVTRDETKAAFVQGKVAVLAESAAVYATLAKECSFKIEPLLYPTMKGDPSKAVANGYGDGMFIPSNSSHVADAVECLKVFTGVEVQKIHADAGFVACNVNTQPTDPTVLKLIDLTKNIQDPRTFTSTDDSKYNDYINKVLLPNVLLNGKTIAQALTEFDAFRLQVLADNKAE